MTDKYEEHNRRVLDNCSPFDFITVINEAQFDALEAAGDPEKWLNRVVVSRPLKALVHYPGDKQAFHMKRGYLGRFGGYKKKL